MKQKQHLGREICHMWPKQYEVLDRDGATIHLFASMRDAKEWIDSDAKNYPSALYTPRDCNGHE